jgi:hypothetical protein
MHRVLLWLALFAAPFWETKAPRDWTEQELERIFQDSPWAQTVGGVRVYLATARPMRDAESELTRRRKDKTAPETDPEYAGFLREDHGKHLVLAIASFNLNALADAAEARKVEEESILKVGKKRYKMTGHFPPTPSDPCLRLVYPRELGPDVKALNFELYLPGVVMPYRNAEFRIKDLMYHGAPEM